MPGPRKNLTPLDMKMLGLAYNQGGIINFLGKQPEVTAPVRAQSHADSPPTQLTYITDAEKDLLVKANIHGSLAGKPNPGPAGLPSLDDFYMVPDSSKPGGYSIGGGGGSTGGGPSIDVYTAPDNPNQYTGPQIGAGDAVTYNPNTGTGGNVISGSGSGSDDSGSDDSSEKETYVEKTKKALLNFITGDELNQLDKLQLKAAQDMLNQFQELGINNPLVLRNLMISNIGGGIFGKDQRFSDMEGNIIDPEDVIYQDGELVTKDGTSVRRTREGSIDQMKSAFGDDIFEVLKKQDPATYYTSLGGYMPQTSGGLADLGGQAAINTTGMDRESDEYKQAVKYNNMIFSARADLDRMGKDMFGNKNDDSFKTSGGGGGTYVPPTTTPDDPIIPQDPTLPPGVTPPTTTPKYPGSVVTDYTQLGLPQIYGNQQMPNYGNFYQGQGGQPIGLQNYLDNLRKRFGIG